MPTITLSWSDLALFGLTAGLVGSIVLIGRSTSASSPQGNASNEKKTTAASKKKKNKNKKGAVTTPHPPSPTSPSSNNPSKSHPSQPSAPSPSIHPPKQVSETPKTPQLASAEANNNQLVEKPDDPDFPPLSSKSNKDQSKKHVPNRQRPFAERHMTPVRKTVVDDMLDHDVEKPLKMARVMNIVNPKPQDPPSPTSDPEEGWEKVPDSKPNKSRNTGTSITIGSTSSHQPASTTSASSQSKPSKRQRQNAKKKEAMKALKAADEAERLRQLALHKREQERIKMNSQSSMTTSSKSAGKKVAGGMKSAIGEDGRLIWE